MSKAFSLLILILLLITETAADTPSQLPVNVSYDYELIKFYLQKKEFNLALNRIEEIQNSRTETDSLHYFKGLALKGLSHWEEATDEFAYILINSRNGDLIKTVLKEFSGTLNNLDVFVTIEKISGTLQEVHTISTRIQLLLMIAGIYEENQLFSEANDVYRVLLSENKDQSQSVELKLKIVTNDLFLKNYRDAIRELKPIIALDDPIYNQEALFFNYLANYSLNNFTQAKNDLLILYDRYPGHINRKEIIRGLASLYKDEKKYLLSWYFLAELMRICEKKERPVILSEINELKQLLVRDPDYIDPFENIIPYFPEIDSNN